MAKQVAVIRLAPGEIGYYDELSKITLSVQAPTCIVYSDMNCSKLKQAIRRKQIELITGTLIPVVDPNMITVDHKISDKAPELIKPVKAIVYEEEIKEDISTDSKPKKKRKTSSKRKKKEEN